MRDNLSPTAVSWLIAAIGLLLTPAVAISVDMARGASVPAASIRWLSHLFTPGNNEFALCVLGAAPFFITAVFSWFHLGRQTPVIRARLAGVAGAVLAAAVFSIWAMAGIRSSRSSTAAIAYLFLPFYVLIVMLIGYAMGRVIAKLRHGSAA